MATAVITGGSKGIGRATARSLAKLEYQVWIGARNAHLSEQSARELSGEGLDVRFVQLDVANEASVRSAARRFAEGNSSLDVLVNNAGTGGGEIDWIGEEVTPPSELPLDTLRNIYAAGNVPFIFCLAFPKPVSPFSVFA